MPAECPPDANTGGIVAAVSRIARIVFRPCSISMRPHARAMARFEAHMFRRAVTYRSSMRFRLRPSPLAGCDDYYRGHDMSFFREDDYAKRIFESQG